VIIYKATNLINNKVYIGQTVRTLKQRISQHKSNAKRHKYSFQNAIDKYGIENFIWETIEICNNVEELNLAEMKWINFFKSNLKEFGYNLNEGGKNRRLSVETKEKIRKAHLGVKNTVESNLKRSQTLKGHPSWSKGKKYSAEALKKVKNSRTPDYKSKMAKSKGGRLFSVYHKETKVKLFQYENIHQCAKDLNLGVGNIWSCLKGKRLFHKNYIFKYEE
jgi:group I intron endonuclease